MSILMDSAAVMRGSKSGLETRIRSTVAPHVLIIDGDSCHHMHNASKKLTNVFVWHVEFLCNNIFNDFNWTEEFKEDLKDICHVLRIKYIVPQRHVSHRWLSTLPCAVDTLHLFDAFVVFYHGFLRASDRVTYLAVLMPRFMQNIVSVLNRKTRSSKYTRYVY